jgi:hypothetical protein
MPRWVKVAEPQVRFKGVTLGNRGKLKAFGGERSTFVGAIDADYEGRVFILWTEDHPEGIELPWGAVDPEAFDSVIHDRRLKLFCAHWSGDAPRELAVYDTGYEYTE